MHACRRQSTMIAIRMRRSSVQGERDGGAVIFRVIPSKTCRTDLRL
jgi:hypothetical protein